MYVNNAYLAYLRRECIAQHRTADAWSFLMPPNTVTGKQAIVTVKDTDVVRSAHVDRAQAAGGYNEPSN